MNFEHNMFINGHENCHIDIIDNLTLKLLLSVLLSILADILA